MGPVPRSAVRRAPPLLLGVAVPSHSVVVVPVEVCPQRQAYLAAVSRQLLPEACLQQVEPPQAAHVTTQLMWVAPRGCSQAAERDMQSVQGTERVDVIQSVCCGLSGQLRVQVDRGRQGDGDSEQEAVDVQYEDADEHVHQRNQEVQQQLAGRPQEGWGPSQAAVQEGAGGQRQLQQGAGDRVPQPQHVLSGDERVVHHGVGEVDHQVHRDAAALQHGQQPPTQVLLPAEEDVHGQVTHHLQALQQPLQGRHQAPQHGDGALGRVGGRLGRGHQAKDEEVAQLQHRGEEEGGQAGDEGDHRQHTPHHGVHDDEVQVQEETDGVQTFSNRGEDKVHQPHAALSAASLFPQRVSAVKSVYELRHSGVTSCSGRQLVRCVNRNHPTFPASFPHKMPSFSCSVHRLGEHDEPTQQTHALQEADVWFQTRDAHFRFISSV